jgi:hypothetical protein
MSVVAAECHSKMSLESLPFVYCQEISGEGSGAREVDSVPFTFNIRAMSATSRVATPPKSGVFTFEPPQAWSKKTKDIVDLLPVRMVIYLRQDIYSP